MKTRWVGLSLSLLLLGCTTTEDRCEMLCQWADKCEPAFEGGCGRPDIDRCVQDYDAASARCQDVIDELSECVEEENQSCPEVRTRCSDMATEYFLQCR